MLKVTYNPIKQTLKDRYSHFGIKTRSTEIISTLTLTVAFGTSNLPFPIQLDLQSERAIESDIVILICKHVVGNLPAIW